MCKHLKQWLADISIIKILALFIVIAMIYQGLWVPQLIIQALRELTV